MQDDDYLEGEPPLDLWETPPLPRPVWHGVRLPALMAVAGVFLLLLIGVLDERARATQLWGSAILFGEPTDVLQASEQVVPISLRRLPAPRSPLLDSLQESPGGDEVIDGLQLDQAEWVVLLPVEDETLGRLLESGRLPSHGRPEALAGDLARNEPFELDGLTFEVVGRLKRGVGGLGYTYVVPDDAAFRPLFAAEFGGTQGWLDTVGREHLDTLSEEAFDKLPDPIGTPTRAGKGVAVATVLGLILVAIGGSLFYYQIFMRLRDRRVRGIQTLLDDIHEWRGLFVGMHVLLYGVFFLMMLVAIAHPLASARISRYVSQELSEGSLSHIGEAYASGDILLAAVVTFAHNYFVATILYTILISMVVPFAGVFKNLLTFLVIGFAMSPLWSGVAAGMSFHSITMAIELGAYIVASFAMVLFPIQIFQGHAGHPVRQRIRKALSTVLGAILISGAMLAFAALYEATTLILLG